jgi:hypothetical protein
MQARFEVQARRQIRRSGVLVSDETEHASATDLGVAQAAARGFVERGFTSWVFRVEPPGSGTSPVFRTVEILSPTTAL